jgi:hypothetical protein
MVDDWSGFAVLRRDKNAKGGSSGVEEPPFARVGGMGFRERYWLPGWWYELWEWWFYWE